LTTAPGELSHLLNRRKWHKGERRVVLVLLSGSGLLTAHRIERTARVRSSTVSMVLMLLEGHDLLGRTALGHYWLTDMGRAFCLQVMGLA
jgi:predicted transcriptional regulator